jgi:hypothetical protein
MASQHEAPMQRKTIAGRNPASIQRIDKESTILDVLMSHFIRSFYKKGIPPKRGMGPPGRWPSRHGSNSPRSSGVGLRAIRSGLASCRRRLCPPMRPGSIRCGQGGPSPSATQAFGTLRYFRAARPDRRPVRRRCIRRRRESHRSHSSDVAVDGVGGQPLSRSGRAG